MTISRSVTRRPWPLPVAAVVTVLAIVGVALTIATRAGSADEVTVPTAPWPTVKPQVSALSAAQEAATVRGCGLSWNGDGSGTGHVYNFVGQPSSDGYGWALIYAPNYVLACEINGENSDIAREADPEIGPYNPGGGSMTPEQLGHVAVPYEVDVDLGGGREDKANPGGYRVIAGRVSPTVDSVRVTIADHVVSTRTSNGTFLAYFDYSDDGWLGDGTPRMRIEAFADGPSGDVTPVPSGGPAVRWP